MNSRSAMRIPCPATTTTTNGPPGGPPKKNHGNKIFACLCPCSVFEFFDSDGLRKTPGGGMAGGPCADVSSGKVGALRRGMIPPDDALLKKPLRIVMEEVDCSKLDLPKYRPSPKECLPTRGTHPKANQQHITAAPCVTQPKETSNGALKTSHLNDRMKVNCSPRPRLNCIPCPEPGEDRERPKKAQSHAEIVQSVMEMTLDKTGNLINQCAPKGFPTVLKVEKLDEPGAAQTVIKITYCAGRPAKGGRSLSREHGQQSPKKHRSSHRLHSPHRKVVSPANKMSGTGQSPVGTRHQEASSPTQELTTVSQVPTEPASSPASAVQPALPARPVTAPAQDPEQRHSFTPAKDSVGSEGSPDSSRRSTRKLTNGSAETEESGEDEEDEDEYDDEDEDSEDEEDEEDTPPPKSKVVNIALVKPSSKSRHHEFQIPKIPSPEDSPLPLPRPIWLRSPMARSSSPPCHDKEVPRLFGHCRPITDEVLFESQPSEEFKEIQVKKEAHDNTGKEDHEELYGLRLAHDNPVKEEAFENLIRVKATNVDVLKNYESFSRPARRKTWRSTALRKTIHGTNDVSVAISFCPMIGTPNENLANPLRPLMSGRSTEELIRQLHPLPLPSQDWGLQEGFEALTATSSVDMSKVKLPPGSTKLFKGNEKKMRKGPSLPKTPPTGLTRNTMVPNTKLKRTQWGQSNRASMDKNPDSRKRNMRVICTSTFKRDIRPSSVKTMPKETAV